jgi:hypothetical protein
MRKNGKYIIYSLCIISWSQVVAQEFTLTLIRTEKLSYETRDLWNVVLQNLSQQPAQVFLNAYITEQQQGKAFEVRSADFILQPGVTVFHTSNYSQLLPEQVIFQKQNFRDHLVRTSSFPNGAYEICVFLYDSETTQILARDCYDIIQLNTTPPYLVAPFDQDTVRVEFPFFIWSPPAPQSGNSKTTYTLAMYEIYAQQNYISASQTNPEWLLARDITSPIYQYGIDLRQLVPGKRYTWFITAYINGLEASRSEIWWFVYQPSVTAEEKDAVEETNKRKPGTVYYRLAETANANKYTLKKNDLCFIFTNQSAVNKVPFRIIDFNGNILHYDQLDVSYGQNYISLNLSQLEKIKKDDNLLLEIEGVTSPKQFLSFKYLPTEK